MKLIATIIVNTTLTKAQARELIENSIQNMVRNNDGYFPVAHDADFDPPRLIELDEIIVK